MKKKMLLLGALASLAAVTVSTVAQTTVAYAATESSKLAQAKQAVSQAQAALNQANQEVAARTNDLNESKARVADAENKVASLPTFTLTPEYVAYLTQAATADTREERSGAKSQLKAINASVKALNTYTQNNEDKTRMISDINRMTISEQQELTFFAQALMNQIRSQMGTPKAHVSNGSVRFASLVALGYVADGFGINNDGHDERAIDEAARTLGLHVAGNIYENLYLVGTGEQSMSMAEAKEYVYKAFLSFMFNGYEWGHAASIAGLTLNRLH